VGGRGLNPCEIRSSGRRSAGQLYAGLAPTGGVIGATLAGRMRGGVGGHRRWKLMPVDEPPSSWGRGSKCSGSPRGPENVKLGAYNTFRGSWAPHKTGYFLGCQARRSRVRAMFQFQVGMVKAVCHERGIEVHFLETWSYKTTPPREDHIGAEPCLARRGLISNKTPPYFTGLFRTTRLAQTRTNTGAEGKKNKAETARRHPATADPSWVSWNLAVRLLDPENARRNGFRVSGTWARRAAREKGEKCTDVGPGLFQLLRILVQAGARTQWFIHQVRDDQTSRGERWRPGRYKGRQVPRAAVDRGWKNGQVPRRRPRFIGAGPRRPHPWPDFSAFPATQGFTSDLYGDGWRGGAAATVGFDQHSHLPRRVHPWGDPGSPWFSYKKKPTKASPQKKKKNEGPNGRGHTPTRGRHRRTTVLENLQGSFCLFILSAGKGASGDSPRSNEDWRGPGQRRRELPGHLVSCPRVFADWCLAGGRQMGAAPRPV